MYVPSALGWKFTPHHSGDPTKSYNTGYWGNILANAGYTNEKNKTKQPYAANLEFLITDGMIISNMDTVSMQIAATKGQTTPIIPMMTDNGVLTPQNSWVAAMQKSCVLNLLQLILL